MHFYLLLVFFSLYKYYLYFYIYIFICCLLFKSITQNYTYMLYYHIVTLISVFGSMSSSTLCLQFVYNLIKYVPFTYEILQKETSS